MSNYSRHNPNIPALELLVAVVNNEPAERIASRTTPIAVARAALTYLTPETWLTEQGPAEVDERLRRALADIMHAELDSE
ncbi:hypothetical protein [Rhodococcus zopfii]|uniref:hypothetical protein n=1 Tax=Rhodococcus zopfii TaxID=43772 RepID=UPI00111136DC|nr:hypothetical protein [Rhodococcus zopfii]